MYIILIEVAIDLIRYAIKSMIGRAIGILIVRFLKFCFVRTEDHIVEWYHFSHKAAGEGHTAATPDICSDGLCVKYR